MMTVRPGQLWRRRKDAKPPPCLTASLMAPHVLLLMERMDDPEEEWVDQRWKAVGYCMDSGDELTSGMVRESTLWHSYEMISDCPEDPE